MTKFSILALLLLLCAAIHATPRQTNIVVDVVGSTETNSTLVLAAETTGTFTLPPVRAKWGFAPYGTNVAWRCDSEVSTNIPNEAIVGPTGNSPGTGFSDELGKTWQGPLHLRSTLTNRCRAVIWIFYE